jgi:hypothetical protein
MKITQISFFNQSIKWALGFDSDISTIWLCYMLQISHQKLNGIARKHNGKFQRRHRTDNNHVVFLNKEDAQAAADELDAILLARKLGKVNV